jgi:hypothetical protein
MEPANTILIRAGEHSQTLRVYPFDVEQLANPAIALSVLEGRAHANTMSAALDLLAAYAGYERTTPPSAAEIAMANAFTSVCLWVAKQAMPPDSHAQIISELSMPGVSLVVSLKDGRAEFQLVTLPPKSTA